MALSKEEFENKCIEVIEQIVLIDFEQNRLGAVAIAEKMLAKAQTKYPAEVVSIYERVVKEFKECSEKEYETLKRQLFSNTGSDND